MQNQPSTIQFSLRALFVSVAFVGLALLALKYPTAWVLLVAQVALLLLVVYAVIAAVVSTGSRRLFWLAFTVSAAASIFGNHVAVPYPGMYWLWGMLQPRVPTSSLVTEPELNFRQLLGVLYIITVSTIAAYIIPWLVQRGQKPPQA